MQSRERIRHRIIDLSHRELFGGKMQVIQIAVFAFALLLGCGEASLPSETDGTSEWDDHQTYERILTEAVELATLRTFISGGQLVYYSPNEKNPRTGFLFTGWAKETYDNGQASLLNQFKDGTLNGLCTEWYQNGHKETQNQIKEGRKEGLCTSWYTNGQKRSQANFKGGKKDGLSTDWYESGRKRSEENFKSDKLMSAVAWKPNGQKCPVTNVKDGNGIKVDAYYEDGTEVIRSTYKDGSRIGDSVPPP